MIRITEVPTFSLLMTIAQDQALKTEMESIEIEAPKSFCPKDSGVSGKIVGAEWREFL
ncbi:hypothetical protein [Chryseobacterium sp.]|uniref:hypothetical protein n=1 Tax=Chryseobacterium sp. TaxID=1871047 RepID=UPI00289DE9E9|nr:hypothetical protein [Chryseobacterium sp.]